ncbi:MAG: NnrS family protein [Hyphomicrobiales bacterium]|nr:NnrS family protein [Hyphomicrobiales bacterium]
MTTTAQKMRDYTGPVVFERGFRPFFLGAGLFAGLIMPIWILVLLSGNSVPSSFLPREWHFHEMVFGYVPAVVAGFLLTAIPNWTGRLPVLGLPLAMLWGVWFAGRIAVTFSSISPLGAAIIDSAFLVVFSLVVWREVLTGKNNRNIPVCIIVSVFAFSNITFHYLHLTGAATYWSERLSLAIVAILLVLVGGRITPSFTLNWMRKHGLSPLPAAFGTFDKIALASAGLAVIAWVWFSDHGITGWLFFLAAILSFIRIARWRGLAVVSEPLLLVLHLGQLWIPIWFCLMALSIGMPNMIDETTALHALSAGAVGTMTMAVITRASLGHAGRPLKAGKGAVAIFALVITSAVVRIFANWLPFEYLQAVALAGILWSMGFLLFVILWTPMLVTRKPD